MDIINPPINTRPNQTVADSGKHYIPWWGKIIAKIILSRLPVDYSAWQRLRLFRHGRMDEASYARNVFNKHVSRAGLEGQLAGRTILEIGPGDSVATALLAHAQNARAILVDVGPFAVKNLRPYLSLVAELRENGFHFPSLNKIEFLDELLEMCGAQYLTSGTDSLRQITDNSVDLIYSHTTLQHIRKEEFLEAMRECARILKPGGVCSHRVDLRDCLGGGLNNLRFSHRVWESKFFARSGFYTNRIQFNSMIALFRQAGFEVDVKNIERWERMPILRKHLNAEFKNLSESEFLVSGFDVLLRAE